jgi:hypothetical protein
MVCPHYEIAEPFFPIGQLEPIHRLHLQVHREQIIAAMGSVFGHQVQEELSSESLPDEAAENVGEGDDDRVNGAALDLRDFAR